MRLCVYCESWVVDEIDVHVVVALLQTDTASVLLEAIGYIRFLQGQIEVMMLINFFLILFFYTISVSLSMQLKIHLFICIFL